MSSSQTRVGSTGDPQDQIVWHISAAQDNQNCISILFDKWHLHHFYSWPSNNQIKDIKRWSKSNVNHQIWSSENENLHENFACSSNLCIYGTSLLVLVKPFWPCWTTARQGGCWSQTWHHWKTIFLFEMFPLKSGDILKFFGGSILQEFHQAFDFLLVPRTMLPKRGSANKFSFGTWRERKTVGVRNKTNILRLITLGTHNSCYIHSTFAWHWPKKTGISCLLFVRHNFGACGGSNQDTLVQCSQGKNQACGNILHFHGVLKDNKLPWN